MADHQGISRLNATERILLTEKISGSVERKNLETAPFQKAELDRRLIRYREGETIFRTWPQVKENINTVLRKASSENL